MIDRLEHNNRSAQHETLSIIDILCLHCRHAYGFKSVEWPRGDAVLGFSCRVFDMVIKGDKVEAKPELRFLRTECLTYEEAMA